MKPVILVDYGGTACGGHCEVLLDALLYLKENSAFICILTDDDRSIVNTCGKHLEQMSRYEEKDYTQIFNFFISSDEMTNVHKHQRDYWPRLMEKYKWDKKQIIFIDNDTDNVSAAENFGITSLCFKSKEQKLEIGDRLKAVFQEKFAAT